jgi:hypothetical protein
LNSDLKYYVVRMLAITINQEHTSLTSPNRQANES